MFVTKKWDVPFPFSHVGSFTKAFQTFCALPRNTHITHITQEGPDLTAADSLFL